MRQLLFIATTLLALSVLPSPAQTSADSNEGVRVTADATTGAQVLTWWGRAGRTYFVQQSYDLVNWSYVPVVHSGSDAVDGLNFACTDPRQFWRLRYTDAALNAPTAAGADFDSDGLTNQQELNLGTDPFKADTDGDGWNDSLEKAIGSNALDLASTPPSVNPNFINLIRSYDVETINAAESYWMDWFSTGRPSGQQWWWSQNWHLPGDTDHDSGKTGTKPTIAYHGFPFTQLTSDNYWLSASSLFYQAMPLPDYTDNNLDLNPNAVRQLVQSFNGSTYKNESSGWGCDWYRYRLRLSQKLPYDYSESYLAIVNQYAPNPDYGQGGPTTDYPWMRTGIREVTTMILTIPAGEYTGAWKFQSPTVTDNGSMVAVQMVPIRILQIPLAVDGINTARYNFADAPPAHTAAPRFARWRNAFTDPGGEFKQDWIKDDPDRVIIRIEGDVIDPSVPWMNVKTKNISGVAGRTTDAGFLSLTLKNGGWETEPFLFVTDNIDDTTYNGDQGTDDDVYDQTRLASFGAEIDVKAQFMGTYTPADIPVSNMMQTRHIVNVEINVLQGVDTVTAQNKADAQAAFDAARLLYRQIGINLVQQGGVNTVNLPMGFASYINQNGYIDYGAMEDWTASNPTGQKFNGYLKNISASTTAIRVFYTAADLKDYGNAMGEGGDPVGWAPLRGDYCIVELNQQFSLNVAYVTAHEIGHVLGAQHPAGSYPYRIMNDTLGTPTGNYTDSRRFSEADEQSFVGGKFYQ